MAIYSKINGTWSEQDNLKFKINDEWNDIDSGYVKVNGAWEEFYSSIPNYLCFTAVESTNITFSITGTLTTIPTVQYSLNGKTWDNYTFGNTIALAIGQTCYWKGDNNSWSQNSSNYINFTSTGRVSASGNIMSLLDSTLALTTIPNSYCFRRLFMNCGTLISAPLLPATTLSNYCYTYMFINCTSLTIAPELPATTLANSCYESMFVGCTSLTTAPALPATTLANGCYDSMFEDCTSLTTAPTLPATTLADSCYAYMFDSCTSLTTAPALPATTLANSCYYCMFFKCASLTTAPALPATTLASYCYAYMFRGCRLLYVSDTSGTGYDKAWKIPTSGTFTNTYSQSSMFTSCLGTRSSDNMAGASGQSKTYYTQNTPV